MKIEQAEEICQQLVKEYGGGRRFQKFLNAFLLEAYGIERCTLTPDIRAFANAQTALIQGEVNDIKGDIQLSPVRTRGTTGNRRTVTQKLVTSIHPSECDLLHDSGAFTDVLTNDRKTPEIALQRQLKTLEGYQFNHVYLVSYDRLIDEKFINGDRHKQRWTVEEGWSAVEETVTAASYLNSQRDNLKDFTLVMGCQGVDANQYALCVEKVLNYCTSDDWIGLGGWCILGRQKSYLPTFWQTLNNVIPMIAEAGIKHIHIFGVTWYKSSLGFPLPPLQGLLAICNQYGLTVSTDSRSIIGCALWKSGTNSYKRAGAIYPYWRINLAWVKARLADLSSDPCYQLPPKEYHWSQEPLLSLIGA